MEHRLTKSVDFNTQLKVSHCSSFLTGLLGIKSDNVARKLSKG
jgi:hypothetical protein